MAAMAGVLNHARTAGQALSAGSSAPMDTSTSGTSTTSGTSSSAAAATGDSATISANDFLTLLVTEMQNQDPTAQTDPNEYINQLVQVNSLEQLIDINQNLSTALGSSGGTSSGSSGTTQASGAQTSVTGAKTAGASIAGVSAAAHKAGALTATHAGASSLTGSSPAASSPAGPSRTASSPARFSKPGSSTVAAISQFAQSVNAKRAPGNLSVPSADPAAHRVAHALNGQSHPKAIPGR